MIPLYILGLLLRYGPQHGYQIKKLLQEQMADFTDIKLPTIYYHLERMEAAGFLTAREEAAGARPEKRVYQVSPWGEEEFARLLRQTLELHYRPAFEADSLLFFSDSVETEELLAALECHISNLLESLERIEGHRREVLPHLPPRMRAPAGLIFSHHALHYRAELTWAQEAAERLKEAE